jgi:hypothetical protein
MTPRFGPDPEQQRRQSEADLMMLRVGLALIGEARRGGDFGTDETALAARVAELAEELGAAPSPDPERPAIEVELLRPDRIGLSARFDARSSQHAGLTIDGILFDQGTVGRVTAVPIDREKLSEDEREDLDRRRAEWDQRMARLTQFTAARFRRAVAAPPRPGAADRILAVLLFDDGFFVDHTFDKDPVEFDPDMSVQQFMAMDREPRLEVDDDLGTEYFESGGGSSGGVRVSHAARGFAPAPPAGASVLRITTDSGTVELDLSR